MILLVTPLLQMTQKRRWLRVSNVPHLKGNRVATIDGENNCNDRKDDAVLIIKKQKVGNGYAVDLSAT